MRRKAGFGSITLLLLTFGARAESVTSPGVYVPTTFPLGYAFAQHRPWFMKSAAQFRPGPPPALTSTLWARDYNEIKVVGSATSTVRTPEQTAIARFWATALPDVHMGIVHSVAIAPGREVTRNRPSEYNLLGYAASVLEQFRGYHLVECEPSDLNHSIRFP